MPPNSVSQWGTKPGLPKEEIPEKIYSKGVFWMVVGVVLIIGGGGYYYFSRPQGVNVAIEFPNKPGQVLLGDQFSLAVSASNYSDGILAAAKLSLSLPDGVSFVGQPTSRRVMEQVLGDLGPGSINQQSFNLIVTSGPNSSKPLEAKLIYSLAKNSGAQFEHAESVDIPVGPPAVSLNITAPQNVFSGQDFEIKATYANNTSHDFRNIHLKIDYPPIFQFERSTVPAEASGNNFWNLGTLSAGSGGTISITGNMIGQEKSVFSFNGSASADFLGTAYTINTQSVNLSISPSPLSLEVVLKNGENFVAHAADQLTYGINFKNNSDVVMQNITVNAKLIGEMFDFRNFQSNASFNSLTNTASWSAANSPALSNLAPGQSGSVEFHVPINGTFPIRLISDKNYTLKVQAQIDSPTIPPNTTAVRTVSVANIENKVAGRMDLTTEAYWRDASSGFLNTGPYPPRVNQPTQYTVHWKLINYSTDVSNLAISAYLQSDGRFTGKVKSNNGTLPTFDPHSGQVTWNIGTVAATKGVISAPLEAVFQIEVTPAVNQIGQEMQLLSESKAEGTDLFTGLPISATALKLDSNLPYDKTIGFSDRSVKQ